jgi:hypothetical protein
VQLQEPEVGLMKLFLEPVAQEPGQRSASRH